VRLTDYCARPHFQVFVESFKANRVSILFFISFIAFVVFGLLYILMATVFSQFQMRLEVVAEEKKEARKRSVKQAYLAIITPALDPNGPPPLAMDASTISALLQQFSTNVFALSPQLQFELVNLSFRASDAKDLGGTIKDDITSELVLNEAEFEAFFQGFYFCPFSYCFIFHSLVVFELSLSRT
jgi:hypothetical protein